MTVGEGALITAGATTATKNVARSWAGGTADARATASLTVGYHPTTLERSHETAKGGVSAFLLMAATLLITTRVIESTIPGVETAWRVGMATMISWARS